MFNKIYNKYCFPALLFLWAILLCVFLLKKINLVTFLAIWVIIALGLYGCIYHAYIRFINKANNMKTKRHTKTEMHSIVSLGVLVTLFVIQMGYYDFSNNSSISTVILYILCVAIIIDCHFSIYLFVNHSFGILGEIIPREIKAMIDNDSNCVVENKEGGNKDANSKVQRPNP